MDAAMRWVEDFQVVAREGVKAEDLAGARLRRSCRCWMPDWREPKDSIRGDADILAHIGWAHWLNRRLRSAKWARWRNATCGRR